MAITVSPTTSHPTHHAKLTDKDANELGFILVDEQGRANPRGISIDPHPKNALKFYQGEAGYEDDEPPYAQVSQENFSGGRGQLVFEKDTNRFFDSKNLWSMYSNRVFPAGQINYCIGDHRDSGKAMPGDMQFQAINSGAYSAGQIYVETGFDAVGVEIWLKKYGSPSGTITASLYSDSGGSISTLLKSSTKTVANCLPDDESQFVQFLFSAETLTSATNYWIKVEFDQDVSTTDYVVAGGKSDVAITAALYGRIVDAATAGVEFRMFEYKGALYACAIFDDNSASKLYINGTRGVADDNSGDKTRLTDAANSFRSDWTAAIAVLTKGTGSEEVVNYREGTGTGSTYLSCYDTWNTTHDTTTEYVILNTNHWTELQSLGGHVTDIAVTDEYVYFARGETASLNVLRYQWYNNAGTATVRTDTEGAGATYLLAINDVAQGVTLWMGCNQHSQFGVSLLKARVPKYWADYYNKIGDLADTDVPFDHRDITNVTQSRSGDSTKISVNATFSTGIIAVEQLPAAVDITKGSHLAVAIKSTVTLSAGDLQLVISDEDDLGTPVVASAVQYYNGSTFADQPNMRDGDTSTNNSITAWTTGDTVYVGRTDEEFDHIYVTIGSTPNANAATLSVEYFNGEVWTAVSDLVDGSASAGATLAVTGAITFTVPYNWKPFTVNSIEAYWVRLKVSNNLTANVKISEFACHRETQTTINFPALTANEWTWAEMAISPLEYPKPNHAAIKSVGLQIANNLAAVDFYMNGGIQIITRARIYTRLPNDANINGLEVYAGSTTSPREYPWVFTEDKVYELQNNDGVDVLVPLALKEFRDIRSRYNGRAHTVNGTYLYFSAGDGQMIERYYNRQLDDVSPTQDEGLPADRTGIVAKLLSLPGMVLAVIDGGDDNYSSVLAYNNEGYHELYRAPRTGLRIRNIHHQQIPGAIDRLWISQGADICYVDFLIDPEKDAEFSHTHEAVLVTSRVTAGLIDVNKFYKSLKAVTENLSTAGAGNENVWLEAHYKIDGGNWTSFPSVYDTSPFQEISFTSDNSSAGRWAQVKIKLCTKYAAAGYHAKLAALVYKMIIVQESKDTYTLTFRLKDDDIDLLGDKDPLTMTQKLTRLNGWIASPYPLTLNSISEIENAKTVMPQPIPIKRLSVIIDPEDNLESHICQMTLIEV